MKPRALKPGDTISLVTPASPLEGEKLDKAITLLCEAGYRTKLSPHALDSTGYLAGADRDRAADLQDAFDDPETAAVLCNRGGYGSARLLPYLDLDKIAATRKLFIGFSDITALHAALNRRGLATLHAPMSLTLHYDREPWVYDSFLRALKGDLTPPAEAPMAQTVVGGSVEAETAGGCLCLLTDGIGTPEELDAEGKILFIEDVDESAHRVDAMFTHLRNAGILQNAAGVVVGEMTRTEEKTDASIGALPWQEIVSERLSDLPVPSVIGYPFGHYKSMLSVGLGVRAKLDADAGSVTYLEALCE